MKTFLFTMIFLVWVGSSKSVIWNTYNVLQHLTGSASKDKLNIDVVLISSNASQTLRSLAIRNAPSTNIVICQAFVLDHGSLASMLNRFLDHETPVIVLIDLNSISEIHKVFQSYQMMKNHINQANKIFILFNPSFAKNTSSSSDFAMHLFRFNSSYHFPDMNSDVYIINFAKEDIVIHEVYTIRNIIQVVQLVSIPSNMESVLIELLAKASRRRDFRKIEIRGTVPVKSNAAGRDISYTIEFNPKTKEYNFIGGYRIEEFMYLRDALNFTPVAVEGDGYVSLAPNGSLLGIGKDVVEDRADIGIPSSEIVPYRLKYLTFLHPTSDQRLFSFFKQPAASSVREIYSQTFSKGLWLAYFAFWIFFTACAILLMWLWKSSYFGQRTFNLKRVGIWDYVFWTFAVILQQGSSRFKKPEPGAMKIVIISGLLTSTTLYAAYNGALVSILMTPVVPVKSFYDLLSHRFILYAEKFTLQANKLLTDMFGNRSDHPEHNPGHDWGTIDFEPDQGIRKITETKATLIAPRNLLYSYLLERNYPINFICEHISGLPLDVYPSKTGMFVKKGSPLKETLNFRILQMFERGIRQRIETRFKKATTVTCFSPGTRQASQSALGIRDIFTAVAFLAFGFIASFTAFVIEKIFQMANQKKLT